MFVTRTPTPTRLPLKKHASGNLVFKFGINSEITFPSLCPCKSVLAAFFLNYKGRRGSSEDFGFRKSFTPNFV